MVAATPRVEEKFLDWDVGRLVDPEGRGHPPPEIMGRNDLIAPSDLLIIRRSS
jgi:hypothetical protein